MRDAGEHVRDVDPVAQRRGGGGELDACVDALGLAGIVRDVDGDPVAVLHEVAHGVGQVQLSLGVGRLEAVERRPEEIASEDVDRRVRLSDRELLRRRVTRLDDRLEVAVRAAHDPPVAPDVGRDEREHGRAGLPRAVRLEQRFEQPRRQERRVAGEDEHLPGAGERAFGGANCVARPEWPLLHDGDRRPSNAPAVSGDATTTSGSAPRGRAASTIQSTIRRPRIGCRCLGVAERMRVPRPPAMTTAASLGRDSDTVGTLAGAPGFEPGITGPKPVALPLGHAPVNRDAECTRTGHPVVPGSVAAPSRSTEQRRQGDGARARTTTRRGPGGRASTSADGNQHDDQLGDGADPCRRTHEL